MIYPGSFIWRRISDEWLVSKAASRLFAVSSILIAAVTAVLYCDALLQNPGPLIAVLCGVIGV